MQQYLILASMVVIVLLLAAPRVATWSRGGRKSRLVSIYHQLGLNILKFWGIAFAAVAGVALIVTISDQIGLSHFGHPASSLPFEVIFMLAGFRLWYFASSCLSTAKSRDSTQTSVNLL